MSAGAHGLFMTSKGRSLAVIVVLMIIAGIAISGRLYGQHLAYGDMQARESAIRQLELERQQLELEKSGRAANIQAMHAEAQALQARLDAIVPSKDRYNINPNQSLVVAGGHLTIGLVGVPKTDGIEINVNGKHQLAAVGDVIHVTPDPSTACEVKIQSFDMFKAQVTASCAEAKS